MDNRIEEIKQALEAAKPEPIDCDGTSIVADDDTFIAYCYYKVYVPLFANSSKWLRYLLEQYEQQQLEIADLKKAYDEVLQSSRNLLHECEKTNKQLRQSREDAGRWELKSDQLAKENEQKQAEIKELRQKLLELSDTGIKTALIGLELERGMRELKLDLEQKQAEIERISADRDFWVNLYNQERDLCKGQKDNLREINESIAADAERLLKDNERLQAENTHLRGISDRERAIADSEEKRRKEAEKECDQLRGELDTTKEELKKTYDDCEALESELDDYRKVLKWYGEEDQYGVHFHWEIPEILNDNGQQARDILSRYKEKGDNLNGSDH